MAGKRDLTMTTPDLEERALQDPQSVFETPEAVLQSDQLAHGHKRTILERWQQLVGAPSSDASTRSREPGLATRLSRVLASLATETGGHQVTHDQGFYTSIGDITKERTK